MERSEGSGRREVVGSGLREDHILTAHKGASGGVKKQPTRRIGVETEVDAGAGDGVEFGAAVLVGLEDVCETPPDTVTRNGRGGTCPELVG
jgi:hypothetical protein